MFCLYATISVELHLCIIIFSVLRLGSSMDEFNVLRSVCQSVTALYFGITDSSHYVRRILPSEQVTSLPRLF